VEDKMKKIVLILILFIFSGCSVNYNLHIGEDTFLEEINMQTETKEESDLLANEIFPFKAYFSDPDAGDYPAKIEGIEYYDIINTYVVNPSYGQLLNRQLKYNFPMNKFNDVNSIKSCYEKLYFTNDIQSKEVVVNTSSHFLCMDNFPYLNEVIIAISSDYPILYSNADYIQNDIYYWEINKDNYENRAIILSYNYKNKKTNQSQEKNEEDRPNIWIMIGILGVFLIGIISLIVYNVKKQNENA